MRNPQMRMPAPVPEGPNATFPPNVQRSALADTLSRDRNTRSRQGYRIPIINPVQRLSRAPPPTRSQTPLSRLDYDLDVYFVISGLSRTIERRLCAGSRLRTEPNLIAKVNRNAGLRVSGAGDPMLIAASNFCPDHSSRGWPELMRRPGTKAGNLADVLVKLRIPPLP
ncbi:hypothetical protein NM688_g8059 [Phlebia brevispora]|uniref:Uncharacterized protein n=1 Tax=Phlebia brevispora TaxID=194682 RepID=A0ACC1RXT2_9APHY|nr:hypothetical protein NM688_g8059 [Phlebia brevispora]